MSSSIHQTSSLSSLTPVQAQVVAALAQGATVTAAARTAGLHRTTVHTWFRTQPDFAEAVREARRESVERLREELKELDAHALSTLRSLLDDPKSPPSVRLKTALAILERPKFPSPGWNLPEPVGSPREEQLREDLATVEADYKQMRMRDALAKQSAWAGPEPDSE